MSEPKRIAIVKVGTTKQFFDYVIVTAGETQRFQITNVLISLAMQVKIRLEKLGPDIETNMYEAMKTVAERSGLQLVRASEARNLGTPIYTCAYFMDNGIVKVFSHLEKKFTDSKDIGALVVTAQNRQKVGQVTKKLRKLAHYND